MVELRLSFLEYFIDIPLIDEMNISQIRTWDSTYRFAGSFSAMSHSTISSPTPQKRVFNRRGLSFALLPTGSYVHVWVFIYTNIYINQVKSSKVKLSQVCKM